MSEETTNENTENTESTTTQENTNAELTVTDLAAIKQIIDVASTRGAFRPNEMTSVGQVYTKLEVFLNAVASQQNDTQGE